ncbi:MAG: molybdopterin-binding protein [Anaerolineales bacterium]|nr:molybdopterin-binding protein [Anaerolineales bacterium]
MKFEPVPLAEAEGKILGHNIAGDDGRRLLRKGRLLTAENLEALKALGRKSVYIAQLEENDIDENAAARRVATAVCGAGLTMPAANFGRANLLASEAGLFRADVERLRQVNEKHGITLATLANHTPVRAKQMAATIKIIPYALAESVVGEVEALAGSENPVVWVDAFLPQNVGMILSGSPSVRQKLTREFIPLQERIEKLGSTISRTDFAALDDESDETILAEILQEQIRAGMKMILLAGETAIMDERDIIPRAIERAGGKVEAVGAPVDPGNLLMLAYIGEAPIVGAPGCARSRKINIVDWVLPRLLTGERLTRKDIIELGHGGLLENAPERGMPREVNSDGAGEGE